VGPNGDDVSLTAKVLKQARHDLTAEGSLALLQSLPRPTELARRRALAAGGFERLANLDYMERRNLRSTAAAQKALPSGFTLDRWTTRESSLLMELLQRTFEGTLDCPGLASMRTSRDILEGHLQSGDGDTSLWRILRQRSNPVGAMLLSPSAATDSVDVIYLGLAPEARGAGLGAIMLSHGLAETAGHSAHFVQLAVDVSNTPAVNLYRRAGFTTKQQREAWVCPLSSAASCPQ
jgi:ribosomal protein S18 acetylase RimI-like enzyme